MPSEAGRDQQTDRKKRSDRVIEKDSRRDAAIAQKGRRNPDRSSPKAKKPAEAKAKRLPPAADKGIISLLHAAHAKLAEADHDYQGHRIRALDHVAGALQHLGTSSPLGSRVGSGSGILPQAQSDQMLRDAISQLQNAEKQLIAKPGGGAHYSRASDAVGRAIHELNVALSIR